MTPLADTARHGRPRIAETLAGHVAGEIRAEMGRLGITSRMLAEVLHKDESWLSRRLNCRYEFTLNELDAISIELGMEPTQLIAGYVERPRPDGDPAPGGQAESLRKAPTSMWPSRDATLTESLTQAA